MSAQPNSCRPLRTIAAFILVVLLSATPAQRRAFASIVKVGTAAATPAFGLVDKQSITVTGAKWRANARISVEQCSTTNNATACAHSFSYKQATRYGRFTAKIVATRLVGLTPCGDATTTCFIRVGDFDDLTHVSRVDVSITFTPLSPPITGTVAPETTTMLASTVYTTSLDGWSPGTTVRVGECPTAIVLPPDDVSCFTFPAHQPTDAHGHALATANAIAFLGTGSIDCRIAFECSIAAWDTRDPSGTFVAAAITVIVPPAGTVRVTPNSNLKNNDSVVVHGDGWHPGDQIGISQCAGLAGCQNTTYSRATADANGTFDYSMAVRDRYLSGATSADCTANAGNCYIYVADQSIGAVPAVTAPLHFTPGLTYVSSQYTFTDGAFVQRAAYDLGITMPEFQRLSVVATAYLLAQSTTPTMSTPPVGATNPFISWYNPSEYSDLAAFADLVSLTPSQFQTAATLFVSALVG